ncbi:hypothetical protein ACJQOV_000508 [Staphylococcus pseudintermedius]|uniref:hypothetical protein n=1 Tax=Staphylococcus pseudintermedius TaxID=283734 RepID=UPI000CFCEEFA|nr:hypothetical protein [Staphylococcus pseudintermedius]EGQ0378777.1 hypothetical protein [Staphylococcus pseudintermedius]EGQ0388645.1 hypothetical protein [Staphylococcus pseudintermedius]EGQ1302457.1 hypothetical protein [Staphylococcus pseudintermedius]EGQ1634333.1 hypothetical protein [Staphylococcus pseudintermedius]EGQ1639509.1 hypothetical protein [Staphylococcus pseudintermedius]
MNNTYDVLFTNTQYKEAVNAMNAFLKETANLIKRGYRIDVVDEKQKGKVAELQERFKQIGASMLEQKKQQLQQIEDKYNTTVENPEKEVIKRQNFQARLGLITDEEVLEDIKSLALDDADVFTVQEYNKVLNSDRFNDNQRNQVAYKMEELKQSVLYPYEKDEAYNKAAEDYAFINSTGIATTGTPFTEGEYGVEYKSVADRYEEVFRNNK